MLVVVLVALLVLAGVLAACRMVVAGTACRLLKSEPPITHTLTHSLSAVSMMKF